TQLFKFLCQVSRAGAHCTFVYDGPHRAERKRGKRVIHNEPLLYQHSRILVHAFKFNTHTAKGEAEAELAVMNQKGVIDAVLTTDSDVFALGALRILRIAS
ncbi:PIN domain-like protein, partial [Rhodocollybia butyracea]